MQTLEQRTEMCVIKIKAMRNLYPNKDIEHCRSQCDGFEYGCGFYMPVKRTELCISRGGYAYALLK